MDTKTALDEFWRREAARHSSRLVGKVDRRRSIFPLVHTSLRREPGRTGFALSQGNDRETNAAKIGENWIELRASHDSIGEVGRWLKQVVAGLASVIMPFPGNQTND